MGVMACERAGCDEIMCRRVVLEGTRHAARYVCPDCFEELYQLRDSWPDEMTADELADRVYAFMESPKGSVVPLRGDDLDAEFRRVTGGDGW